MTGEKRKPGVHDGAPTMLALNGLGAATEWLGSITFPSTGEVNANPVIEVGARLVA